MSKLPVSVCIIAKNEEKYIEECLKRLTPYGMEIVVTDTGSTDRTKEIAARYADKVLDFEWCNDFSAARNFCASKASNSWILSIDCDEYVESLDTGSLRLCMQQFSKDCGKLHLKNIAKRYNGDEGYVYDNLTRFYNRHYYHFDFPIHESIEPKPNYNIKSEQRRYFRLPMEATHYGYNITGEEMKKKQERNLNLLFAFLESDDNMDAKRKAYTHYQIAQSYHVIDDLENAIEHYKKVLELNDDLTFEYVQTSITELATTYAQNDQPQEALEVLEGYKDKLKNAKFVYKYALALMANNEMLKALVQLVAVTTMSDRETLGEDLLYCYRQIIEIYKLYEQPQLAEPFEQQYKAYLQKGL
jgi:glycosyltransferase involved in cell wall biosynthesis